MAGKNTEAVVATPREGKFNKNAARRVRVEGSEVERDERRVEVSGRRGQPVQVRHAS